ncbi:MAG: DUF4147 domain-containing protein [Thermoplasmata archaeon]|nr:MAG: DUF4147 domain-containing protein [Thermoplasmata archaeon]
MSIFLNYEELIKDENKRRAPVLEILEAGVKSVLPEKAMKDFFSGRPDIIPPKVTVFGWGKASLRMFSAFKNNYHGDISAGHIITLPGEEISHDDPTVAISYGTHPLPDESSIKSGEKLLSLAEELNEEDTLVCLISGGGSAMFEVPKRGVELESLQETYKILVESGADIHEVNSVRRALSQSKGGQLAKAAHPAEVINIVISDVLGNHLEDIASGATVEDPLKIKPLEVVKKFNLEEKLDSQILKIIQTYKPVDKKYFENVQSHIIADNEKAVWAMHDRAEALGYEPTIYSSYIRGETRTAAVPFMEATGELIIGGGETTVTVTGKGRGGRNQEFVLAALKSLEDGILASIGTDGVDGNTDAAGAVGDVKVLETARKKDYDIDFFLEDNNSHEFFNECGGLIKTGNTGTNVADICVYLRNNNTV